MTEPAETIADDEAARFEGYAAELRAMQKRRAERRGTVSRALHAKQHLGLVGELTVTAAEDMRRGVFADAGRTYPVYVRYSNGSGDRRADAAPDARGVAVKLVGVAGKKIIPGLEDKKTQDFLFIAEPAIAFRSPDEFMKFARVADKGPLALLPALLSSFGLGRGLQVLRRLAAIPKVASMAAHPFYTAVPILFGEGAAVKLALVPTDAAAGDASGPDALRDDLARRVKAGPLTYSMRAQRFADERSTPVEDASVAWATPFVEIGKLTLPRQDPDSEAGRAVEALVESLSFDPWHAVEAHRPLGAVMRARAVAYRESVLARRAADEPEAVLPPG